MTDQTDAETHTLARRFRALWQRCSSAGSEDAERVWQQLEGLYAEPHRHYHNLDHIAYCLGQLDEVRERLDGDADAAELALWFHDAVYSVARNELTYNEARSAAFFSSLAREDMDPDLVARVEELILATTHETPPDDAGCGYIVDIDLSGFGLPWEEFVANSQAIQREQGSSPLEELVFLDKLDARDRIFQTDYFTNRLEAAARDNIARYRALCLAKADG